MNREERHGGSGIKRTPPAPATLVKRPSRKQKTSERRPPGYQPTLEELYADLKKLIERSRVSYLRRRKNLSDDF